MDADTIQRIIIAVPALVFAIVLHEVSHGYIAYKLGDPTAKLLGRLTLNPFPHIDLVGTIILPLLLYMTTGLAFGYAKPVPINPHNFRNPLKGMAISAAGGPATNIILGILSGVVLRFVLLPLSSFAPDGVLSMVLLPLQGIAAVSILINFLLAAINLIPIPPLDGGRVLVGLLPTRYALTFSKIEPFGFVLVILLFMTHISDFIVLPLMNFFLVSFHMEFSIDVLRSMGLLR